MTEIVTRFAPSPTGFMHIGNLRTALYAWLLARAGNGKFIVRIEDTDQVRLVEGAVEVILQTLSQTGLNYDEGPGVGGPNGPYVQSERKEIYRKYAEELVAKGHAYYCFCTAERLQQLHDESDGVGGYDRHCRNLSEDEVAAHLANGEPYVIRQKIPLDGVTSYTDEVFGEISMENKEMQDQILLKADGYPTYNFAHVVDDYLMGVTHVVRGSEYLTSTPKYVLLYDAFGWPRPHYVHLPLLMGMAKFPNSPNVMVRLVFRICSRPVICRRLLSIILHFWAGAPRIAIRKFLRWRSYAKSFPLMVSANLPRCLIMAS